MTGGIDLAAEWAGFETVLMVENNAYCQKVLKKHWPDVPIIGDIKDVTKERVMAYTENWWNWVINRRHNNLASKSETRIDDSRRGRELDEGKSRTSSNETHNGKKEFPPITLITGGFPCQPVSHAGKRRGKEDDRWLWPEMLRVISEVRPAWVVAENVTGLLTMGFYDCLSDLEDEGYETISFVIPACGVNAPHRRDRIFIVAHCNSPGRGERWGAESIQPALNTPELNSQDVADTGQPITGRSSRSRGRQRQHEETKENSRGRDWQTNGQWAVESAVGGRSDGFPFGLDGNLWTEGWEEGIPRVATGVKNRVDRLKALGNAVVPQQIYPILKAIADIEQ